MRVVIASLTLVLFVLAAVACGRSDDVPAVYVPVVVANEAIPADTRITADMLKVEYMSPDEADPDAFTSRSQVMDRVATEDFTAGATIVPSMVSDTVTYPMPPIPSPRNIRAVAIEAEAPAGIRPGDSVDLVGVFIVKDVKSANDILKALGKLPLEDQPPRATGETGDRSLSLTVIIYPNLRLLAVAQPLVIDRGLASTLVSLEVHNEPRPTTVNQEATREQAEKIIWADEVGTLRLERANLVPDCCFSAIGIYDPPTLAYSGELR